jgi:hypothetical protein
MLKVGWTVFRINDSEYTKCIHTEYNEISEPRGLLKSIKERRWRLKIMASNKEEWREQGRML